MKVSFRMTSAGFFAPLMFAAFCAPAPAQQADTDQANAADQQFVTQAIAGGNEEIAQARAELQSTSDSSVKIFAQTMIRDHTKANTQIIAQAQAMGLKAPDSSFSGQSASPMPAAAYMRSEVADHEKTIALFKGEERNGSRQMATVAAAITPVLDNHLAMAQQYVRTGQISQ